MSGGPGGGVPDCVSKDYTDQFFEPTADSVLSVGESISISWYGGPVVEGSILPDQFWNLTLHWYRGGSEANSIVVAYHEPFIFGHASWTIMDVCGHSNLDYTWIIPANLSTPEPPDFVVVAQNVTDPDIYHVMTSDPFVIKPLSSTSTATVPASSVTLPLSSTTVSSTTVSSTPVSSTSSESNNGNENNGRTSTLSTGAKAGIGVGAAVFAISVLLGGWWLIRQKKKNKRREREINKKDIAIATESGACTIAELDPSSLVVEAPAADVHVQKVSELPA
ncbi:hypothetical protein HD806DRAFT_406804 [Xylariaceae sp. AK1471]|nr:hypothetical protein HD806DRAFT_406804 [Xylariaceae sp. AK1471]